MQTATATLSLRRPTAATAGRAERALAVAGRFSTILLGSIGALMLMGALVSGISNLLFVNGARVATGAVVTHDERMRVNSRGQEIRSLSAVVEYRVGGESYRISEERTIGPASSHAIGDRVEILYDPVRPTNARINTWTELWLLPGGLALFALILGGAAFLIRRVVRRKVVTASV